MGYEGGLIGEHSSLHEVRRLIARVAASSARAVLIYGETGTGKGVVARLVHQQSSRARQEFVDVNCAAIPDNLLKSELFGHEKGAFTGALAKKTGLIEVADKGSIFLDEIRDMNSVMQAKLLTLMDTQRFRRVGAVRPIEVDVRFIAATNRILLSEVKEGRFREDLYYRLQVVAINIPPLRERGDDVFVLTDHFLRRFAARYGRRHCRPRARSPRDFPALSLARQCTGTREPAGAHFHPGGRRLHPHAPSARAYPARGGAYARRGCSAPVRRPARLQRGDLSLPGEPRSEARSLPATEISASPPNASACPATRSAIRCSSSACANSAHTRAFRAGDALSRADTARWTRMGQVSTRSGAGTASAIHRVRQEHWSLVGMASVKSSVPTVTWDLRR